MICPQCTRQLGPAKVCPVCKVATVEPSHDADSAHLKGVVGRIKREKRNKALKKMILPVILLLGLAALVIAICWPMPLPVMAPTGDASQQMLSLNWSDFQDKMKFGQPAHFEITDAQLTALARKQPGNEATLFKFNGPAATIYLRHPKLPATLIITFTPALEEKHGVQLRVDHAQLGQLPLPAKMVEDKIDEAVRQFGPLLKGVTGFTVHGDKLSIDFVPKMKEMPNGAVNWQVIQ